MSQIRHFYGVKFKAWKSGGVKFWTNITSAGHFDELRSISCWVARVWGEPRPCWRTPPRSAPRPSSSSRASAPSSKWTRCLQTKNCTQSVHFPPPNYLRDPQNQPSISKTQKASRMSTSAVRASTYVESLIMWQNTPPSQDFYNIILLIDILLISFVLQNIVGTNCNCIVCPYLTCH